MKFLSVHQGNTNLFNDLLLSYLSLYLCITIYHSIFPVFFVYITLRVLHGNVIIGYHTAWTYVFHTLSVCHITLRVLHGNVIIGYSYCMLPSILHFYFKAWPGTRPKTVLSDQRVRGRVFIMELVLSLGIVSRDFRRPLLNFTQSKLICTLYTLLIKLYLCTLYSVFTYNSTSIAR